MDHCNERGNPGAWIVVTGEGNPEAWVIGTGGGILESGSL